MSPLSGPAMAWRLARREARSGFRGFRVFLACLALGVGAMAAVGNLSAMVDMSIRADARRILGGDLEVSRMYAPLPEEATRLMGEWGKISRDARVRVMAQTMENAPAPSGKTGEEAAPVLAELKAVDGNYPLVGRLEVEGGGEPRRLLAREAGVWGALAHPDLARRLGLATGDRFRLGGAEYRLTGLLAQEPDRASRLYNLGPRVLVSLDSLADSGLLGPGSLASYDLKVVLNPGRPAADLEKLLRERFPEEGWRIRPASRANESLEGVMDNFSQYLTLVSLASLLIGGVGVAGAVKGYLESRLETLAVFKCLGASRDLVTGAYLLQILALAGAGSVLGLALGLLASLGAGLFLGEALGTALTPAAHPGPLALALLAGLLTALTFSLWPLSAAAGVSPASLFRGYLEPGGRRPGGKALLGAGLSLAGLLALVLAGTPNPRAVGAFLLGSALSLALLAGLARLLAWAASKAPRPSNPRLRQAMAGLHRPGAATLGVVVSLGLGLTAVTGVSLVDGNLQAMIGRRMPETAPSYFFLGVPPKRLDDFLALAGSVPGVERLEYEPSIRGRITAIKGKPPVIEEIDPSIRWALRGALGLSFAAAKPQKAEVVAGSWWPADYQGPPLISLDGNIARGLKLSPGDELTINVLGRDITAKVANLREIDWRSLELNHSVIFAPGLLEKAPFSYLATARAAPRAEPALARAVGRAFPDVVMVHTREVLGEVARVVGKVGLGIRATAGLTLLTGLLVLSQALRADLRRRYYEAVIFKVLGATRRDILTILALEFLLLGGATALLAGGLGSGLSWWFVTRLMHIPWQPLPLATLCIAGAGTLAVLVLGLLGMQGVLGRKAWPVLRNE